MDQEFYDKLSDFVDDLMASMPASVEAAIIACEKKAKELRRKK